jgi:hypothetical protein
MPQLRAPDGAIVKGLLDLLDWETDWYAEAVLADNLRESTETEVRIRMLIDLAPTPTDAEARFIERLGDRLGVAAWATNANLN